MTALTNFTAYKNGLDAPKFLTFFAKASPSIGANNNRWTSPWATIPLAGAVPTTAVTCDNTTAGALVPLGTESETLYLGPTSFQASIFDSTSHAQLLLVDRLSHQGGLSATSTSAQTTNLPTAALTRYTSGVGVMAMLEIYTAIGTATTASITYTNSAGTGSRVSQSFTIGGSGLEAAAGVSLIAPLADDDLGVRSVESVTLAASTGTVGNFGVTLIKPLPFAPCIVCGQSGQSKFDPLFAGFGAIPEILSSSCLEILLFRKNGNANFVLTGSIGLIRAA